MGYEITEGGVTVNVCVSSGYVFKGFILTAKDINFSKKWKVY